MITVSIEGTVLYVLELQGKEGLVRRTRTAWRFTSLPPQILPRIEEARTRSSLLATENWKARTVAGTTMTWDHSK